MWFKHHLSQHSAIIGSPPLLPQTLSLSWFLPSIHASAGSCQSAGERKASLGLYWRSWGGWRCTWWWWGALTAGEQPSHTPRKKDVAEQWQAGSAGWWIASCASLWHGSTWPGKFIPGCRGEMEGRRGEKGRSIEGGRRADRGKWTGGNKSQIYWLPVFELVISQRRKLKSSDSVWMCLNSDLTLDSLTFNVWGQFLIIRIPSYYNYCLCAVEFMWLLIYRQNNKTQVASPNSLKCFQRTWNRDNKWLKTL